MQEHLEFYQKYPNASFNDNRNNRNKNTYLYAMEPYCIIQSNYEENIIAQYRGLITWNKKIYDMYKDKYNCYHIKWFTRFNDNNILDSFINYDDKINGMSLICRHRLGDLHGDTSNLRLKTAKDIHNIGIPVDCYGIKPYGGSLYKGIIGKGEEETSPGSISKLKKLNEYKFNLCFENCYHELWSYGWITEKITDCFKAKTIPIYYGCYDIEKQIPLDLFIDYREFNNSEDLVKRLNLVNKNEYEDMTEKALEYIQGLEAGTPLELKKVLEKLWYQ